MTTDSNIALHLNNISVSYQHKPVLDKLSLTIADNEIMCLLGQSGRENDSTEIDSGVAATAEWGNYAKRGVSVFS